MEVVLVSCIAITLPLLADPDNSIEPGDANLTRVEHPWTYCTTRTRER